MAEISSEMQESEQLISAPSRISARRQNVVIGVLLVLILLVGGSFRFMGLNWDDFSAWHPDERYLTLNLLPHVGGALEFTPDGPTIALLARIGEDRFAYVEQMTIADVPVGAPDGTYAADAAFVFSDNAQIFPTYNETIEALLSGVVDAVFVDELPPGEPDRLLSLGVENIQQIDSVMVQQTRCIRRYPGTNGIGNYFDTQCSPWNPHNAGSGGYAYGTLPLLMAHWAGTFVQQDNAIANLFDFQGWPMVWRTLSAFFDTFAILLVFLIGRRLHNNWVGLLAAVLYACAVLPIQKAHFGTVNAITNYFVILAILFAAYAQTRFRYWYYVGFGLAFGAALAGRINVIPLAGLIVVASIMRGLPVFDGRLPWNERQRLLIQHMLALSIAGISSLVMFRLANPHAFTATGIMPTGINPRWLNDMSSASYGISGYVDSPPNWQWLGRPSYLFPLKDMLLWGMGLAFGIAAWFGWAWAGYRFLRGRVGATQNVLLLVWVLVFFGWLGRQWVMTMRYYLPLYGALAVLAAWALWELARRVQLPEISIRRRYLVYAVVGFVPVFTLLWALMFTNIYRHQLTRVQAARWLWENVPGDFSMQLEGVEGYVPLINIPILNTGYVGSADPILSQASYYAPNLPVFYEFVAPATGQVSAIYAPHLADPQGDDDLETMQFSIAAADGTVLTQVMLTSDFVSDGHPLGNSYDIALDESIVLRAGERYTFRVELVNGDELIGSGMVVADEGAWDDQITATRICRQPYDVTFASDPPPGIVGYNECNSVQGWHALVNAFDMAMSLGVDTQFKVDNILLGLDNVDYITISSNRFYDTLTRNPARWPVSSLYYESLFSGELGFELVAVFSESFEFGPFQLSDQYIPTFDSPDWLNEFEPDEAFHVYDHPVVFIFRKTDDYSPQRARDILYSVPLTQPAEAITLGNTAIIGLVNEASITVDVAPSQLMLPVEPRETQQEGGTWSSRFHSDSLINTQPFFTVVLWWLAIMVFGFITWPLLFVLFPALADRGYGFAKFIGLFLTGYLAWTVSSLRFPMWSQSGIILAMLILTALSAVMVWRIRQRFLEYIRANWRRLAFIELITLTLFVVFLFVRLTNPDLWHPFKGGEKPMDFAYFNAVLRSTVFPPADPWFAGGYLNYYYFGFVIVGTPVLLLGVVPSIAYNLIIPTLFAVTGIAAFSVAFSFVHAWRERQQTEFPQKGEVPRRRLGNPWVAGIAALMLAVVLGNLDTVRVFGMAVARSGGYQQSVSLQEYMINRDVQNYIAEFGTEPDITVMTEITDRAANATIVDRIGYEINHSAALVGGFVNGALGLLRGEPLAIASDRWYWGPSRVIMESPDMGGNAITEMPYFTFLYGDLHAHMINMPLLLFIVAFVYNELLVTGRDGRGRLAAFLALALGAMAVGMVRATNTWDWPSFLVFGIVGMTYIWWLRWKGVHRRSLIDFLYTVVGFTAMTFIFALPYTTWYAAAYDSVNLWTGNKTALWAYFDIHGTFLFLIFSLLIWDTARWLRSVQVRELRGTWLRMNVILFILAIVTVFVLVVSAADYQVALVVVPTIVWIIALFFRKGQSRTMQYVLVLVGFALALTLGVEVVVIGGDIGRQNTVFKFYMQVWLLFSVVGGAAFAWLLQSSSMWSFRARTVWYGITSMLFIIAALYPIVATRARSLDRMAPPFGITLDGMAYMQYAQYFDANHSTGEQIWIDLSGDYGMIRWLQENVEGTPYIMEGRNDASEYTWTGRISIYTGLPSVIGWSNHQRQQRTLFQMHTVVNQRSANVSAFYDSPDIDFAVEMLRYYDISYVIVGTMERAQGTEEGLAKFDTMVDMGILEVVYEEGESVIYRVNRDALTLPVTVSDANVNIGEQ